MNGDRLGLSLQEFASEIGVSRPTAYQIINRDDFPKVRVGRRIIIPRSCAEEWLRKECGGKNNV